MAGTLLFDLDGTLVDSAGDLAGSLDTLMQEKGKAPIGIDIGRQLIGHGIANLVRSALKLRGARDGEEDSPADLKRFMEIYGARLTQTTRPYPNVMATLQQLAAEGWTMAVCTNKRELFARAIVDDLGMSKFFPVVSGPDTFGVGKPDPRHLLEIPGDSGLRGVPVHPVPPGVRLCGVGRVHEPSGEFGGRRVRAGTHADQRCEKHGAGSRHSGVTSVIGPRRACVRPASGPVGHVWRFRAASR